MGTETTAQMKKRWLAAIRKELVGRTIKQVWYMNDADRNEYDWYASPVIFELDNGEFLFPSSDDEGNGPGSMFTTIKKLPVIPVI